MNNKKVFRDFVIKNLALPEEYSQVLCDASKYNTYVETLGNKADNLHLRIKDEYIESLESTFSFYAKKLLRRQHFGLVDLVCDITSENFYGKIQGLHIHPWTGENGVKGKFQFLVVGILFRNKILPFFVSILSLGSSKANLIGKSISFCKSLGLRISKILLDRGFYSGEIMGRLDFEKVKYLIFAKKSATFKYMLEGAEDSCVVEHTLKYNKNFTWNHVKTDIVLVKNVFDYDWVFATNLFIEEINNYVQVYRARWNIETMFRVHDEAKIKTKSKLPIIRLFYFILGMLLVLIWNVYEKQKITFKLFVIKLIENKEVKMFRGKN